MSGEPECGQMKIENGVKFEDIDSDSLQFSMAANCDECKHIMNKRATLLTSHTSYDYLSEGFSLGDDSYLIGGGIPIKSCQSKELRSVPLESSSYLPKEQKTTTTTTTTTEATLITTNKAPEVVKENSVDGDQPIERRNVQMPAQGTFI